ncbi:MAG: transporter substrate-binding domain-containing protein [Desulfococcaceae bacterium]|nr:transporter substrate-binding domain-containing protein [Desulfococcaceae bacterium]
MRYFICIMLGIMGMLHPVHAAEEQPEPFTETLVFSGLENSELGLMVEEVLTQAYRNIGIRAEIKWLPGARALQMADEGKVDGAQLRVAGISKKCRNLLMVPVPVYESDIVVFTKKKNFPVSGWAGLKPYKMAVPEGYTAILDHVTGFNCWVVNYRQMFRMLDAERVDIAIVDRFNGLLTVRKLELEGIRILEPSLSRVCFYNYLHKKHKGILPRITASLEKMRDEGKMQAVWNTFETGAAKKKP